MSQFRLARISLMVAALGLSASPAFMSSAYAQDKKPEPAAKAETLSAEMFKIMDPNTIQNMIKEKKFDEVRAKLAAADAHPTKTPFEVFILNRLKVQLGAASGDDKMTMDALMASLESGRLTKEDTDTFTLAVANLHYNQKNYAASADWLKRYQKSSPTPEKVNALLSRALYLSKDYPGARAMLEQAVAADEKAGKVPGKEDLQLLASAIGLMKDVPGHYAVLEKQLAHYPDEDMWIKVIKHMQNKPGFNHQRLTLDVYRLQTTVSKAMEPAEYTEMAELALLGGLPTEAKKALDSAFAANLMGTGPDAAKHKQLRDRVNKNAADDLKTIAAGEAAALKNKDATGQVNLGFAYVTMDQFDKGIDLIVKGIERGGMKRPDEAKLKLGVAYARAGRKDEAIKTFESIKGTDGASDIARFWIIHLKQPAAVAAAPAPAAK